ncbi:hypothetical protein C8J57DRAFT_1298113, partial [Mycena rebaudengoi]
PNSLLSYSHRLPSEILAEIFKICAVSKPSLFHRSTVLKTISHVCHLWRRIVVGCCELWTEANYEHDHFEWLREQLRQHSFCTESNHRGIRNLRLALEHSPIHTLDLQASPEILDQVWPNLDSASLKSLSLFIPSTQISRIYPGPKFQLNAPQLQRLALSNFMVPWDASIFSDLTHLHLHLQGRPACAPSMIQILDILVSSPMLEELCLLHTIECSTRLPGPESVNTVHPTMKLPLVSEMAHSISKKCLSTRKWVDYVRVEVEQSCVNILAFDAANPDYRPIHVRLRWPGRCSRTMEHSLAAVVSAFVNIPTPTDGLLRKSWERCLQNMEAVQVLKVRNTPHDLVQALSPSADGLVLFPRLKILEIHQIDFDPYLQPGRKLPHAHLGNWWQKPAPTTPTFIGALVGCLRSRQQSSVGIDSLLIARCPNYNGQQLGLLKQVVKEVLWQGIDHNLPKSILYLTPSGITTPHTVKK